MNILFLCVLLFATTSAAAQLNPSRPVADPNMVIKDRGAELELMPHRRLVTQGADGHKTGAQVTSAAASSRFAPNELGVVFNHAMQATGYITGEITFAMRGGAHPDGSFGADDYPALRKLTDPNVYLVRARSPEEFITVLKRLQARGDLEWVTPTVMYRAAK